MQKNSFLKASNYYLIFMMLCWFTITATAQQGQRDYATPSQLGMTGLIYTPNAYLPAWGMLDIGYTHFHKEAAFTFEAGKHPERTFLASMVFLPFVELSVKLTKPYANVKNEHYGLGDRSISIRLQVLKEQKYLPAILIGIQDAFGASSFFNTNYLVLTKKYDVKQISLVANLGYGISFEEERLGDHLQGIFGGAEVYWKKVNVLAEYDTDQFNVGVGYQFKKFLFLKMALVKGRYFSGSLNLRFFIR